jgi:conjugative transfer signal peptidase TraF
VALILHTKTPFVVMLLTAVVLALSVTSFKRFGPTVLINQTRSEPLGFYRLLARKTTDYRKGSYVVFPVPESVQSLVYGRGWIRDHIPLLKELVGLSGDRVCISRSRVDLNGAYLGPVSSHDREGLPLPQLRGCFVIPGGFFFAASRHLEKSFDGRYFGALPLSLITGEAVPLWTF